MPSRPCMVRWQGAAPSGATGSRSHPGGQGRRLGSLYGVVSLTWRWLLLLGARGADLGGLHMGGGHGNAVRLAIRCVSSPPWTARRSSSSA
eukprot:1210863-Heterocapsa_arctica.AAC.1